MATAPWTCVRSSQRACLNGMVQSVMAGASEGGKTARFTGTVTEDLRAGHADHRIGGIGPDQRTVQQGYTYAESHRNTRALRK